MCVGCMIWSCCRMTILPTRSSCYCLENGLWQNLFNGSDIASTSMDLAGFRSTNRTIASTQKNGFILYRPSLRRRRTRTIGPSCRRFDVSQVDSMLLFLRLCKGQTSRTACFSYTAWRYRQTCYPIERRAGYKRRAAADEELTNGWKGLLDDVRFIEIGTLGSYMYLIPVQ